MTMSIAQLRERLPRMFRNASEREIIVACIDQRRRGYTKWERFPLEQLSLSMLREILAELDVESARNGAAK